jgi:hypothetical protein
MWGETRREKADAASGLRCNLGSLNVAGSRNGSSNIKFTHQSARSAEMRVNQGLLSNAPCSADGVRA